VPDLYGAGGSPCALWQHCTQGYPQALI